MRFSHFFQKTARNFGLGWGATRDPGSATGSTGITPISLQISHTEWFTYLHSYTPGSVFVQGAEFWHGLLMHGLNLLQSSSEKPSAHEHLKPGRNWREKHCPPRQGLSSRHTIWEKWFFRIFRWRSRNVDVRCKVRSLSKCGFLSLFQLLFKWNQIIHINFRKFCHMSCRADAEAHLFQNSTRLHFQIGSQGLALPKFPCWWLGTGESHGIQV